ncbi:hypothetical protein PENARI_c002G09192 [Penicillium arizonense]|uniref:WSC domain-containing protein n=1 Tax=Penicillium arizonense TaxID=1835702 RepID=A0A1F5LWL7_PENAI|nr:hypothetical protein PENARI_c002G09192 [Penicillium arizonense]OGE57547.1 hypothetical protein PENARI_c002G09192 [Penicillium arizonense]
MQVPVLVSTFALLAPFVSASSNLAYCASDNTGSSFSSVTSTFQSNGACLTTCANYALGIIQGKKCWCSNVAPSKSSQTDTSDCDTSCPGYPADSCGSASKGVFAYVSVLGNSVTSTAGGSSSTSSTSSSSSESTTAKPSPETVTVTASEPSKASQTSTTSQSSTTTSGSVTFETNSGGQVKTITVSDPTSTSGASAGADSASADASAAGESKLSGGSIAGVVIGVLGGLALIGALVFMIFFYRKRARSVSPIPSQDMADNRDSRGSSFGWPQGADAAAGGAVPGRSATFTDRRMKPNAVLYPNGPRDSSVSLQDNEDYSRPVLRLTNPD